MTEKPHGKILLLHGNSQTGELLLGRISKLKKKLLKVDSPNDQSRSNNKKKNKKDETIDKNPVSLQIVAPDAPFESPVKELMRTWWTRVGEGENCEYSGLEQILDMLHDLWMSSSSSSFKGILGFSQGARLAHLIALLHCQSNGTLFHGLEFVVFASGYYAPLPTNFPPKQFSQFLPDQMKENGLNMKTLHIFGARDELITPQQSRELASKYNDPSIHQHQMGHCVPMRAADVQAMISFIASSIENSKNCSHNDVDVKGDNSHTNNICNDLDLIPDEEHAQIQIEECESLELIYPEHFSLISPFQYKNPNDHEEGRSYSHPICYCMSLHNENVGNSADETKLYPKKPLSLKIQYTSGYPDVAPILTLQHDMNLLEFKSAQEEACLTVVRKVVEAELGMPCIMSCILAMKDFIEEGGLNKCLNDKEEAVVTVEEEHNISTNDMKQQESTLDVNQTPTNQLFEFLPSVSKKRMEECDAQGQEIVETFLKAQESVNSSAPDNSSQTSPSSTSKGGEWRYTIGLVGKPSAGKSTFFNAATAFARQRNDDVGKEVGDNGNIIFGASMAPHPFTTIDPNVGFCLVPAPVNACPEDDVEENIFGKIGSTHGRDHRGRRLLPVTLKDVAGLVPGAYKGRGKGNKFLNDLTDADVLIHVVDASGSADTEGNQVGDGVHPLKDLAWIRNELFEWIYGNVASKWSKISRRGKDKLLDMFSGYKQTQTFLLDIMNAIDKYIDQNESEGCTMADLHKWDQGDLRRLISAYLGMRFPMALALNKSDMQSATKFVNEIVGSMPIHGARVGVPLSALVEMNFIKQTILSTTDQKFCTKDDPVPNDKKENSVWECLQAAMSLREPVLVFPVSDMTTYASYSGMDEYATRDVSLPSPGMISCLEASSGDTPTLWNSECKLYLSRKSGDPEVLRDVLMMKQGSTVDDVFLLLKRMGALSGDFVRAEACSNLGDKPKLLSKYEPMGRQNRIIKIMTTKKIPWQKKTSSDS